MEFILELQNIRFGYPKRPDFQLEIGAFSPSSGLCTALTGPNGSGKTTLGKIAAGILRPDAGRVLYCGQDIAAWKLGEIGAQMGYLFQEPARQIFAPKVLEELCFPLTLRGVEREEAEAKAREMLREFGLLALEGSVTYTLSRGEKQRLAIAAAMVMGPKFFILDEPTTGLDKKCRSILAEAVQKLCARGVGALLISHDLPFVHNVAGAVRRMEGGRIVDEE